MKPGWNAGKLEYGDDNLLKEAAIHNLYGESHAVEVPIRASSMDSDICRHLVLTYAANSRQFHGVREAVVEHADAM